MAAWVGHSGGQLIYSTYGHINSQHKRDAAAKLQFDKPEAEKQELDSVSDLSGWTVEQLLAALQKKTKPAAPL